MQSVVLHNAFVCSRLLTVFARQTEALLACVGLTPVCADAGKGPRTPGSAPHTRYSEHLSWEELQSGLKTMQLFKGVIRVNANDKSQAYLSLPGLTADIFIKVCWALTLKCSMLVQWAVDHPYGHCMQLTSCAETCSWYGHASVNTLAYPALLVVQGGNCPVCPSHFIVSNIAARHIMLCHQFCGSMSSQMIAGHE